MTRTTGIAGPALAFDGTQSDAIEIPDADLSVTATITASGWLDPITLDASSGYGCMASRQNGSAVDDD